ncbi:hypothetical protein MHYP_G00289810 [Metynnis hypsauchen]
MALLLRVYINPKLIRKVKLTKIPESVEQLKDELREKLELEGEFSVQYEDPDFGEAVCSLMDITELPAEKAVLHVLWNNNETPSPPPSHTPSSISSLDTANISSPSSSHSASSAIRTYMRNISKWPTPFQIPSFSYDVELKLRKGNDIFEKTGTGLSVTRDMKMEILDKLAQEIFALKAYPEKYEIESVASELVNKHPCLKEPGSGTGYDGWATSIKYKLGNYRSKLRQAGCNEVSVNRKRRRDEDDEGRFTLKKPKRGEVNHVPDYPKNYDDDVLEDQRCLLVDAMKKKGKDIELISEKMDLTFSLRRKEIVQLEPMVLEIQERWPALFLEEQICEEFCRITTKDLIGNFRAALDKYAPRLLKLYRARKGAFSQDMDNLLEKLDEQVTDPEDERTKGVKMGILTVLSDDAPTSLPTVVNIAIVLEEAIVLTDLPDLPTAFAYLFGLLYALNMEFPKEHKYTFEAIQHIFMELSTSCSQRVRSLKTKLLL